MTRPPINWTGLKLAQALAALPLPNGPEGSYSSIEERRAQVNAGYAAEYSLLHPKAPARGVPRKYRSNCLVSLRGYLKGAELARDFVGVGGNYPGVSLWLVSCPGFAPNVAVSALVYIDFDIGVGGNRVSVAPYIVTDGLMSLKGGTMSYIGTGRSGPLTSTVAGQSSRDGTVTIGIYVGIPDMKKDLWTLSARQGSYIQITQP